MGEPNWRDETESYLRDHYARLCATAAQSLPFSGLRINPALGIDESKYFLLGLEEGLFQVDREGKIESELLRAASAEETGKVFPLFRNHPRPPRFYRETVCQLSVASSLILKRGWLRSHVLIEPITDEHRSLTGRADILVQSATGDLLICVRVKRSVAELEKLITDLRTCCHRGPHAPDDCGFPQNHPTYGFRPPQPASLFLGSRPMPMPVSA